MALALFDSTICIIVFRGNQTMQIAAYGHVISLYSNNCQFDIKPRYRVNKMILPYNNSRLCIPATRCILCLQTKCQTLKSFKSLKKKHLSYFKETFVLLVFNVMNALEGNAATETAHPPMFITFGSCAHDLLKQLATRWLF